MSDNKFGNVNGVEARMRDGGVDILFSSLEEGAFISTGQADIRRLEDGILITLPTNPFINDKASFLGIEFFIPNPKKESSPVQPTEEQ